MKRNETTSQFPIRPQQVPAAKISVHCEVPTGEPSLLQLSVLPLPSGVYPNPSRMTPHAFASAFEDVAWWLSHPPWKIWMVSWDYHSYQSMSRVDKIETAWTCLKPPTRGCSCSAKRFNLRWYETDVTVSWMKSSCFPKLSMSWRMM